jgi:hypothetical protein
VIGGEVQLELSADLAAEAGETQYRVQLDRVRRDAGLAVGEVEEGDPGNACSSARAGRGSVLGASAGADTASPAGRSSARASMRACRSDPLAQDDDLLLSSPSDVGEHVTRGVHLGD